MEVHFAASRLQIDNLLPSSHHSIVLRVPGRKVAVSKLIAATGGCSAAASECLSSLGTALRVDIVRRAAGHLQLLNIEVQPLEMALEASLFVHVGRLLSNVRRSAIAGVSRTALAIHLGAQLAEPPNWSGRQPLLCDVLRISSVSVKVSSWLDFRLNDVSDAAASRSPAVSVRSVGHQRAVGVADWLTLVQQIPVFGSLLQAMVVLVKGVGIHLANVSGVPFKFDALHIEHPAVTPSELVYMCDCSYPLPTWPALYPADMGHAPAVDGDALAGCTGTVSASRGKRQLSWASCLDTHTCWATRLA